MSLQEAGIIYKKIPAMQIASITFNSAPRQYEKVRATLQKLFQDCQGAINGPVFVINHFETADKGTRDFEVCVPVACPIETDEIKTRFLLGGEALTATHPGPFEKAGESLQKVSGYAWENGLPGRELRIVFTTYDPEHPENNRFEAQTILISWPAQLAENLKRLLGESVAQNVTQGVEAITVESSFDERCDWIRATLARLDQAADPTQKYEAISPCAHVFPQRFIDEARAVYERNHDIDEVIQMMIAGHPVYAKNITREGNIIYSTKPPLDKEGYQTAQTSAEKRMCACFCPMIRTRLDTGISATFCNCSAGWDRQLYEGIFGKPVRMEVLETVLKGDEFCRFAIYIPE